MQRLNTASPQRAEQILGQADCLAGDVIGDTVRITGPQVANKYQVAAVGSGGSLPSVGIVLKKSGSTTCIVQFDGPVRGVYTGLTPNAAYVVGTDNRPAKAGDGNFPTTDPIQQIGIATSNDELLLGLQDVVTGGPWTEDEFTATAGQITFILSSAPSTAASFSLMVNGVFYDDTADYTVSGVTVTWLNTPFALEVGDKLHARYQ
jgi:hypothetical protein